METPLQALRGQMARHGIHGVLIPSGDFHGSEYVGAHFACRAYVSGFTGSAGTLLVLEDWAALWTDGRYFLQAERELADSGITLMRQGEPGVPTLEAALSARLCAGQTLAFDGRCLDARTGGKLQKKLSPLGISLRMDLDLVGTIWQDRPALDPQPAWLLETAYAGQSREEKLLRVRQSMEQHRADCAIFTALEEIGWLLNLRGGDIPSCPVVLSYLAISNRDALLFANPQAFSPDLMKALAAAGVALRPYDAFYDYAAGINEGARVLVDRRRANCLLLDRLPSGVTVVDRPSPVEAMKAIKNETEIQNINAAHVKDGLALTQFMYWLKQSIRTHTLTELDAAQKLEELRREQQHYLGPSFSPIMAYGPHGAIVHYSATLETNAPLQPEGFLLADTGGHYLEGTTDCTRTFALGPLSPQQKAHYTAVLRGNLNLANAQFLKGCTGVNLDYLARAPLWALGLDFNHGTGHGVGYLLNVHEGPNRIHMRSTSEDAPLEPGMITSNEPGFYLAGQYGIRLENLLLCVSRGETPYGTFLGFQHLSLVPFDLDAVDSTQMTQEERQLLNHYHQTVRIAISPHLNEQEATWLTHITRAI